MIWISLLKKPIKNIIKFLYTVKPTQRHDDIIISTRSLIFRKKFSFYTIIISYIPKRGHHNVVVSIIIIIIIINTIIIIIIISTD